MADLPIVTRGRESLDVRGTATFRLALAVAFLVGGMQRERERERENERESVAKKRRVECEM